MKPTVNNTDTVAANPWLVLFTVMVGTLLIGLDRTVVNLCGAERHQRLWHYRYHCRMDSNLLHYYQRGVCAGVWQTGRPLWQPRHLRIQLYWVYCELSMLCGACAWDFYSLVFFRAIQGLVGAAIYPTVAMSLIAKSFTDTKARAQALGIWSSSFAVSAVIGPLLGGYLIDHFSWRMIFYINLPIGIAGLIMTLMWLPHDKPTERGSFDWFGSILLAGAITSMVLVLDQGQSWGWSSIPSLLCYAGTVLFGWLTYWWETRHDHPIIDFGMFKNPVIVSVLAGIVYFF